MGRHSNSSLIGQIGLRSEVAQRLLEELSRLHDGPAGARGPWETNPWFALWREHCSRYFDLDAAEAILDGQVQSPAGARLFLAHSYGRVVLTEFTGLALGGRCPALPASLYDWAGHGGTAQLDALRRGLRREISEGHDLRTLDAVACSDVLAAVYQGIFPAPLRHLLGEYYTPSWLVQHCIDRAMRERPATASPLTILDPAAGSGSFLAHCITHVAATGLAAPVSIVGFDVNPLAVDFCRANTLLAASRAREKGSPAAFNIRIHLADAVADPAPRTDFEADHETFHLPPAVRTAFLETLKQHASGSFAAARPAHAHVIVGNPPWIAWDGLTRSYRDRLAPQWAASTLMVNSGWRAKVAAGKTEFASLFVYRAAERHAAARAVMTFVLPLALFQSHLSGAGFRAFRTAGGRHFGLVALDDFSAVKAFPDAANRTCAGTFSVDRPQQFPVRYDTWSPARDGGGARLACVSSPGGPLIEADAASPIVALAQQCGRPEIAAGPSDYRARGGVNTGGANTILWLNVLAQGNGVCEVSNVGRSRRSASPVVSGEVESDAVWPLLRGVDMRRWKAAPGGSILLLYNADRPKKALPLDHVQNALPKAWGFVSSFREQLESRKEYRRWGCAGPYYEVYRIGPYTFSPIKVAWRHTGWRGALNVSVVDDRGRRPAIPDQKVILIPFDDIDEAHYVCAVLSSSVTSALLGRYLGADASTHILDYVALRKFSPYDGDHRRLATLSMAAHQAAAEGGDVAPIEKEIDVIAACLQRR